jgi:hypothetical protein
MPRGHVFHRDLRGRQIRLDVRDALLPSLRRQACRHTLVEGRHQRGRIWTRGRCRDGGEGRDGLQGGTDGLLVGAHAVLNLRGLIDPRDR